jgi:lipopolysaccharide/colanic/teichoic acid biosynthesis glycosyltransferase
MYQRIFKRLFDLLGATIGFLFLLPLFLVVFLVLALANNGFPFFIQKRPGRGERVFHVIKFKTMNDRKDEKGNLLPDAKRLTKIGTFVRKTSLDELPQLLNVIKGDMSLIGPRPLLVRYLPYFKQEERLRFSVRPGITGLAQVLGRNTARWDDRLALDVTYVKDISFRLDMKILRLTVLKVLTAKNIVVDPESIMQNLDDERRDLHSSVNA